MRKKGTKICVIVPAYNEEHTIVGVIKEIRKVDKNFMIVVVNDGSADGTSKVVNKQKVTLLEHSLNLGIGGAVQTGLKYAKKNNYDIAVQVDGDGQHDPKYLPLLINNLNDRTDMVIGSRYVKRTNYSTPLLRRLGIIIFSKLIKLTCSKDVFDSTSGYRVFGSRAIELFSQNYPQDFPEPRSIVTLLRSGLTLKEIPVEMRKRLGGTSSVTPFFSIYLMLSISIAILLDALTQKNYE